MRSLPIISIIIFLAIIVGANIYLSKRFSYYFSIEKIKYLYLLFTGLTLFMILGTIISYVSTGFISDVIFFLSSVLVGILMYLLLSLFLIDIIHLIFKVHPKIFGLVVIGLTIAVSTFGVWNAFHIRVTEREISIKGLTKEIKIIHISDVHVGHLRGEAFIHELAELVNEQNPDIVFITGDLFDDKSRLTQESIEPLTLINTPIYFVEGNHDNYAGVATVKLYLRNLNINVLENQVVNFGELQIIGLNHMRSDQETHDIHASKTNSIKETLDSLEIDESRPTIMLHHSPEGIKYASQHGIDLILSGHTHSGQFFPINLITALMFPYNSGVHSYEGTKINVSQGTGTVGPPFRVGTRSEIILIKLVPEK